MNVIIQKLNGLWHLIVGSCRIRTPFLETQDPRVGRSVRAANLPWRRSSNATDFSSYASKDRVLRTYGSRVALTTAEDDDGGSQRLEIGGFHLRKRDVCGSADRDDGREGLF